MSTLVRKRMHYSSSFKLSVVKEFLLGDLSQAGICRKYSISHVNVFRRWIRIFAPQYTFEEHPMSKLKRSESDEIRQLKRQLQQKELELTKEKMRADLLDTMVDVAE